MVKYQERYWIETNAEWTSVQQHDSSQKIRMNNTISKIATRFEIQECGSLHPIRKTEYDGIYILYEYGFDMNTGKKITRKKDKFEEEQFMKIIPKTITPGHTRYEDEENKHVFYGFLNEKTHMNMKMDLYPKMDLKVETKLNTISPDEIELDNMFSKASVIESGIYSKEQLVQERQRELLHEYMRDREKPLQEATSANAQKLLELVQLRLLGTYINY